MIVALVFFCSFLAFVVSAVAGGGAGLVLVPLMRLILPVASIPGALSIGTAVSSLSRIWLFWSRIRWDVVRRFVPTAIPAAALGAWLLTCFEPVYVEFLLGCLLLLNLPALFRRSPTAEIERPLPLGRLPWLGAAAGLLSGFTGAVGVVFNRAYYRMGLDKEEIVATRATNEVLLHLVKIGLYAAFGLLPRSALIAGALIAVAALAASFTARHLVSLMHERIFRRAGLLAMVASGVVMFSLSGTQIMTIHRVWVSYVAPGDEHEIQLYWGGVRRFAFEREDHGSLALERTVARSELPAPVSAILPAIEAAGTIVLIEEVRGDGHYYEIYWRYGNVLHKAEVTPRGTPRHRALAPLLPDS
ncbi:putative membrane protein YfcA [Novosphingobium capsulatum]|uniref:Probable membrane transporter protein n=1 Tax=Novosphingobium capsulatum TaxID=13688 RepID=A0ABU1MPK1_9SPHN|nr:sulfite exporter TauE/SafE family protein [Novosphingobium capsulatum]MDR6511937.1 putative membrane protein YfcA [Novosphingobium capsulatum]